jgi:hypothetical protein
MTSRSEPEGARIRLTLYLLKCVLRLLGGDLQLTITHVHGNFEFRVKCLQSFASGKINNEGLLKLIGTAL